MADALPARSTRKKKTRAPPQARRPGATVSQRILEAVAATKERRGLSLAALKKALSSRGYDVARNNWRVNQTVRSLVTKGSLLQLTGTGALGSFRLSKTEGERPSRAEEKPKREPAAAAAAARERRKRRQRAARQPTRKAAPRSRGSPRKIRKDGAARKGARMAARKPRGRKATWVGAKRKRQREKLRKLAKRPEEEAAQTPAQEESTPSEKESQVCSEQEDST